MSGPSGVRLEIEMFPKRVPGTKNSFGSNVMFSMLSVASYARFHATFATFNTSDRMIHLRSATNDCDLVRVSVVQYGIG